MPIPTAPLPIRAFPEPHPRPRPFLSPTNTPERNRTMSYVTGFLLAVPEANKEAYVRASEEGWAIFSKHGCLGHMEAWGDNIPDGETTSFPMAVKLQPGEVVVFSWLIWPDRATADACFAVMQDDPDMKGMDMPFDGKRMMWGGFSPVFER